MNTLEKSARPYVVFDPANKVHRRWVAEFQIRRSWGPCPVRFVITDDEGDNLVAVLQRKLIEYYTAKEFGKIEVANTAESV